MIDRLTTPPLQKIYYKGFPVFEKFKLSNGAEVYFLENNMDDAVRLDLVFEAGGKYQSEKLTGALYSDLIFAGTKNKNAQKISESMDYLGAYYGAEVDHDQLTFQFYGLDEKMEAILEIATEAIDEAIFPQQEFDKLLNIQRQKMMVGLEKVGFRARRLFNHHLFKEGKYGNIIELSDFDSITRDNILDYHNFVKNLRPTYFLVGKKTGTFLNKLEKLNAVFGTHSEMIHHNYTEHTKGNIQDVKEKSIQSAVRVGTLFPNVNHPDFYDLKVLNTALGGYFGSRLMMNIREDKGWTYGIGSMIVSLQDLTYFSVVTEVNGEKAIQTVEEIDKEFRLLREDLIKNSELEMVKNYMVGKLLRSVDGQFSIVERLKAKVKLNLPLNHEERILEAIDHINADKLMQLANQYLQLDKMLIVTSGDKY